MIVFPGVKYESGFSCRRRTRFLSRSSDLDPVLNRHSEPDPVFISKFGSGPGFKSTLGAGPCFYLDGRTRIRVKSPPGSVSPWSEGPSQQSIFMCQLHRGEKARSFDGQSRNPMSFITGVYVINTFILAYSILRANLLLPVHALLVHYCLSALQYLQLQV